jgi:hypothetical protein
MVHCIKMNMRQIEFFIHVVAESGSFSRASAMIGLTQPAIGRQVSALERELRLRLLHRRPRRCADGCRKAVSRLCQRRKDSNSFSQRAPSYSLLGGAGGAAARDQAACGAGDRRYRHEPAAGGRRLRSVRFGSLGSTFSLITPIRRPMTRLADGVAEILRQVLRRRLPGPHRKHYCPARPARVWSPTARFGTAAGDF